MTSALDASIGGRLISKQGHVMLRLPDKGSRRTQLNPSTRDKRLAPGQRANHPRPNAKPPASNPESPIPDSFFG
jgi:hypothetical protein